MKFKNLCLFFYFSDYVGFIKKIMKLVQHKYATIDRVEVELKQIEEPMNFPVRPCKYMKSIILLLAMKKKSLTKKRKCYHNNIDLTKVRRNAIELCRSHATEFDVA